MGKPIRHRGKWRIRWIDATDKRRSEVYKAYKDAEYALKRFEAEAEDIRRGLRPLAIPDTTFSALCDYWLTKKASQKRSERADRSMIAQHLRPAFGGRPIREIGVALVDEYISGKTRLSKKTVANHLTLLISMLNLSMDLGWLAKAPKIKKPKTQLFNKDFRYLKTDEEIGRFLRSACDEGGEPTYILYATAIYTGMRAGELAALRWEDVSFERRLITVQRSFDGPTKSDDVRYVPIVTAVLKPLKEWRLRCPSSTFVFPNEAGQMHQPSARIFQETLHRVLKRARFPEVELQGCKARYIRFHDLRHTFASLWVRSNGEIFKLQKILGHKSITMTQRYAHLAPHAFADDLDRFSTAPACLASVILPFVAPPSSSSEVG